MLSSETETTNSQLKLVEWMRLAKTPSFVVGDTTEWWKIFSDVSENIYYYVSFVIRLFQISRIMG
jgi:hypothetical protein